MRKLIKEIPYIRLLLCLITGIFFAYHSESDYFHLHIFSIVISLLFLIVFHFVPWFYRNHKLRWISGVSIFFFLFSIGWLLTKNSFPSKIDSEYNIVATGKIKRVDNKQDKWLRIVFSPEKINNSSVPFKKGDNWMLIVRNNFIGVLPESGKLIEIKGTISGHSKPDNPDAFDYGAYLFRSKISGQLFIDSENIVFLDQRAHRELTDYAEKVRSFCVGILNNAGITGSSLGIVTALILGERSGIDKELNDSFVRSGAVHMLAVSGLHVGIIYLIINFILNIFFKPASKKRMILAILLMFIYAFITGFSPSVTRAVVMFSFMQIGKSMAKSVNTYNTLCASAFFLLLINPMFLYKVGFWLSHLAVAGIVAFTYPFENLVKTRIRILKEIWKLVSVSMAAQLGLLPILLYLFGSFPIYFLVVNILVLPMVTPIIILTIILLAISWIPILSDIIVWVLNFILLLLQKIVIFVDSLPYSYLEGIWVSVPMIIALYFVIISMYNLFNYVSGKKVLAIVAASALALLIFNIQYVMKTNDKLIVFSTGNNAMIELINKGESTTFASSGLSAKSRNYAAFEYDKKNVVKDMNFIVFDDSVKSGFPLVYRTMVNNNEILLLSGGDKNTSLDLFDKPVDFLIIFGKTGMDIPATVEKLKCNTVAFTSNCPPWLVSRWVNDLNNTDVKIHNIKEKGAFIVDL